MLAAQLQQLDGQADSRHVQHPQRRVRLHTRRLGLAAVAHVAEAVRWVEAHRLRVETHRRLPKNTRLGGSLDFGFRLLYYPQRRLSHL